MYLLAYVVHEDVQRIAFHVRVAVNPKGIDPNYFYADYLVYRNLKAEAMPYLEKALKAPPRPGRELADEGRRGEIQALMAKIRS